MCSSTQRQTGDMSMAHPDVSRVSPCVGVGFAGEAPIRARTIGRRLSPLVLASIRVIALRKNDSHAIHPSNRASLDDTSGGAAAGHVYRR